MSSGNGGEDNRLVISYLTLRKAIGISGIALPVLLIAGAMVFDGLGILASISAYYYTKMEGVLVGLLFVTGAFLFSYKGYERKDDIAGDLACVFALGTALFPTDKGFCSGPPSLVGTLHFIFAALYFTTLIYFCLFLFTKTDKAPGNLKPAKQMRNFIYKTCGYIMIACIILIGVYFKFLECRYGWLDGIKPVFVLETLALWAFGFSWLVKGETVWKDKR